MSDTIRLRMKKHDEDSILLTAVQGIDHYGFGTFLCNLQPNEIESDIFAKNAVLRAEEKCGLNGMEIWADHRVAWGSPSHSIIMPVVQISKQDGAEEWLAQIKETVTT